MGSCFLSGLQRVDSWLLVLITEASQLRNNINFFKITITVTLSSIFISEEDSERRLRGKLQAQNSSFESKTVTTSHGHKNVSSGFVSFGFQLRIPTIAEFVPAGWS